MKFKIVGNSLIYVEGCYRIIEGENCYEPIEIEAPLFQNGLDFSAMSFRLTAVSAADPQNAAVQILEKRVSDDRLTLSGMISADISALAGEVYFSLTGTNGIGVIAKFDCIRPIPVRDDVTEESLPDKTVAEQLLAQTQLEVQKALDAAEEIRSAINEAGISYTLPTASETVLGGVKIDGETITIDGNGVISAPYSGSGVGSGNGVYILPTASATVKGGIKVDGTTTTVDENGVLHAAGGGSYTLPKASATVLGGIKIDGTTTTVDADGVLSVKNYGGITHNSIWRGADITADYNSGKFSENVADGSFENIFMGDYIQKTVRIDNTDYNLKCYVVDCDPFYAEFSEGSMINTHHIGLFIIGLPMHNMNSTATAAGGYAGSEMQSWLVNTVLPALEAVFGSEHILVHGKLLSTDVVNNSINSAGVPHGAAYGWALSAAKISLLSSSQVNGAALGSSSFYDCGAVGKQFSAFKLANPARFVTTQTSWWVRDIFSVDGFVYMSSIGTDLMAPSTAVLAACPLILLK